MPSPFAHLINNLGLTAESQGNSSLLFMMLSIMDAHYEGDYAPEVHGTYGAYFISQLEGRFGNISAVRKLRNTLQQWGKL